MCFKHLAVKWSMYFCYLTALRRLLMLNPLPVFSFNLTSVCMWLADTDLLSHSCLVCLKQDCLIWTVTFMLPATGILIDWIKNKKSGWVELEMTVNIRKADGFLTTYLYIAWCVYRYTYSLTNVRKPFKHHQHIWLDLVLCLLCNVAPSSATTVVVTCLACHGWDPQGFARN